MQFFVFAMIVIVLAGLAIVIGLLLKIPYQDPLNQVSSYYPTSGGYKGRLNKTFAVIAGVDAARPDYAVGFDAAGLYLERQVWLWGANVQSQPALIPWSEIDSARVTKAGLSVDVIVLQPKKGPCITLSAPALAGAKSFCPKLHGVAPKKKQITGAPIKSSYLINNKNNHLSPAFKGSSTPDRVIGVGVLSMALGVLMMFVTPARPVTLLLLSDGACMMGNKQLPMAIYQVFYKNDPKAAGSLIVWGNLFAPRDAVGAMSFYDEAVRVAPDNASAYMNRGNNFRRLKNDKDALSDFNKAIALNPRYSVAYNNRALYFQEHDDDAAALADFDKAVENNGKFDNPSRPFIWFNRGTYLMEQKNYAAAIADFTAAIEHDYREAAAFNKRAYCYLELQQFKEALNDYRAILKTHPTDTIALHGEADALQRAEVAGGDRAPSAVSK